MRIYENATFGCYTHDQITASGEPLVADDQVPQRSVKNELVKEDLQDYNEDLVDDLLRQYGIFKKENQQK